jgi:hypothetical protein
MDPVAVDEFDHGQAVFLDLNMSLEYVTASKRFDTTFGVILRPCQKPGNAYAYIPFKSFHGRHVFCGLILAEIIRLLTLSSKLEFWQREGMFFYHHLLARGYPRRYLAAVFGEITWDQRSQILISTTKMKEGYSFFETYRAYVLTL